MRRVLTAFTARADRRLAGALAGQLRVAMAGVRLARAMASGELSREDAHRRMARLEHQGDGERAQLVDVLGRSLITPADREDLFRLSRSIDDVLDTLRDFVRESHLYQVPDQSGLLPMLDQLVTGVTDLGRAVDDLVQHPRRTTTSALRAKKSAGRIRRMYQHEIADLFSTPVTSQTLLKRELALRLETAGVRLAEAADALADGAVKRWH